MAEDTPPPPTLAPPKVTALKEEAAATTGNNAGDRVHMVRTISENIREEREELKKAAEQSMNAIVELDLDGKVKWASPSWQDVTGMPAEDLKGKNMADVIVDEEDVFARCVEAMRKDDSKSRIVRFSVKAAKAPNTGEDSDDGKTPVESKPSFLSLPEPEMELPENTGEDIKEQDKDADLTIELEAQGIMVYDRETGAESHTMWMVKPAVSREITIDLPDLLVESLGIGAEMLADYLTQLTDVGLKEPESHPPPLPVLCRICERQITPWWFEKHTELCAQDHRAEMEVQMAQDSLNEQRSALVKVLDALEAQHNASKSSSDSGSPTAMPKAEYKGLAIGPNSAPSSGPSSGRASPATHMGRSRDSSSSGAGHRRSRSFAVRRPLARIVELVLDLCDTAMEISTPSVKDSRTCAPGEIRTQSPQSENHIRQVMEWQSPSTGTLENEQGLALLCNETAQMAKSKCEAVFRHRRILEYSERIRIEYEVLVSECIEAAIQKAERIKSGDLSDSGEETGSSESVEENAGLPQDDTVKLPQEHSLGEEHHSRGPSRHGHSPSSMAMALRNASDPSLAPRRTSSAGSSRTSSPHGAKTPKSYNGPSEPMAFHKRNSIVMLESDAGAESDSSMQSSVTSGGHRRADSPGAEMSLSRVASTRSRDRKRQSLVLPSLANTGRHQSPGRGPPQPSSPLRMAKPRIPSAQESIPSPLMSPTLSHSEFNSPVIRAQHGHHHHRRQSSAALSEAMGRPASPRMSAVVSNPQPRAVQTSIKDFEIIKPISKGAFGSVYLSKKKSTGDYYAIKVLKKADMVAKNQVTNVKAERAIMMWQGESDYVAKLYWTFSSKDYLYLVMEYLNGGDCASLIKVLGALPEDWTMKYMGEVVQCVQHLHSRQIVHRDLKPDNLLIDAKGHLKLTDFGLSRMGLIGRQKRAINAKAEDAPPDLLKAGPFARRAPSIASSRSTSFDFQGSSQSPAQTPSMTPAFGNDLNQPSYFTLNRDSSASREPSRRTSGHGSDSGESTSLSAMFRRISIADGRTPIEEETDGEEGAESPDPYALQHVPSNQSAPRHDTPPQSSHMPPPMMALFDPEDSNRRFVGTPDYLAPETINGAGQDEMSDWWSLGCILFECLYGRPPFNADTADEVFNNILTRNIHWPSEDEDDVSEEAKDLMNRLMCLDPKQRLGSNIDEKYENGGEEIKAHPWFADINWETLREDEASFIPVSENPEDTEYFDARGATMQNFAAEFEDQASSPAPTPGADYPDRPHDALSRVRSQVNAVKRNLMPLHIPPHVRDARSRRLSEPVVADDFGNFQYKNLPVLEKANKDVIQKLRHDAMQAQAKTAMGGNNNNNNHGSSSTVASPSPQPSLESSPVLPMPLKRAMSTNRGNNRPQSPSLLSQAESSPSRGSHPSSPLMVQFSTGQHHERRKTSSGSSSLSHATSHPTNLAPGSFFEPGAKANLQPTKSLSHTPSPSPSKSSKAGSVSLPYPAEHNGSSQRQPSVSSPRQRSHTVGSQEGDLVPDLMPAHYKRRSGVFDVSPSSSDTEEQKQKVLRVQRRRGGSRRLSQVSLGDVPNFRTLDVLVCEDHPVSRLVMERLLEKMRCRTISVTTGSDAIRYAMGEVKFDIILMEYKLPNTSGADVARMIRDTKNPNTHTPLVAVTGYLKELPSHHSFDALIEKPPTKEKLEEVIGQLCKWKPPSEGWKPTSTLPQAIPHSTLRQEASLPDDSPTTTTSSGFSFGPAFSSSYGVSSRGDSIGSSQLSSLGEGEGHYDSIPVIISRQATNEWDQSDLERNFGGLGISNTVTAEPKVDTNLPPAPTLEQQSSAPAALGTPELPVPRKKPSQEAIEAKRRSLEKDRQESATQPGDTGDDEDEELGHMSHVRTRSPRRSVKRTSKLGQELIRVNSQGSVISTEEIAAGHVAGGNKEDDKPAEPIIAEEPGREVEAVGHLTPPEMFPPKPGHHAEMIDMDCERDEGADPQATPRPQQQQGQEPDPDPTPRASGSPSHND